jgi:hypothetical protein
MATVSTTPGVRTRVVANALEPRPPENSTTRSGAAVGLTGTTGHYRTGSQVIVASEDPPLADTSEGIDL